MEKLSIADLKALLDYCRDKQDFYAPIAHRGQEAASTMFRAYELRCREYEKHITDIINISEATTEIARKDQEYLNSEKS